ncbi:hypothetical protein ACTQ49_09820 [Luteococcus sp. Sow4_B9]|uniref:hypothetical protein n=1 Tax=Luteococcus sp. Sow4_B9 TaxID=3438792 RepID=UPI003F9AF0AB
MAEIRKHRPTAGSPIAQALEKALGASVRPVTPGAPPQPNHPKQQPTVTPPRVSGITGATGSPGWVSVDPSEALRAARKSAPEALDEDEDELD